MYQVKNGEWETEKEVLLMDSKNRKQAFEAPVGLRQALASVLS